MADRYICIHGHFYQPPRENPWLEYVEVQDSAYPYHDWNERITAECYAPNSRSRILNDTGKIAELVNNYAWMSFNFGPTLLSWLGWRSPEVHEAIVAADIESRQRFSGHGSALAQAYNHMIMPLANGRDQWTQALWGIADFKHRFGRDPEGMWLPEAAVSTETLEILAKSGIRFTILAPRQASKVRPIGSEEWADVSESRIDPTMPYEVRLPSGKTMVLFFYDGPISQALAFEDLLNNGETFAGRLLGAFREDREHAQLVHIATDGETYGHHRRYAEMALSFALRHICVTHGARVTNYGEYLAEHPPTWEVEIFENSSWSCVHGVERWRSDCGCNSGSKPGWRQHWRTPLREALDWLRDRCAEIFDAEGRAMFRDPWKTRDRYIHVILNRDPAFVTRFLAAQGTGRHTVTQRIRALQLLEMQRHAMLMYTSCGWFFDELSGIETVQVIQYAGRALQLAEQITGAVLEKEFVERLEQAKSNVPEHGDGCKIYLKWVKPAVVDLNKVAAHYAVSSLFEPYEDRARIYSHRVVREDQDTQTGGKRRLTLGRIRVESEITRENGVFNYGVLHLGDHNISGGVRPYENAESYRRMKTELTALFRRDDVPSMIRAVDRIFGGDVYTLQFLFRDEQQKIVRILLETALEHASALYRSFYREYGPLARFLAGIAIPLPPRFRAAVDFTLHDDLVKALSSENPDADTVRSLVEQMQAAGISFDTVTLEFTARQVVERLAREWLADPGGMDPVRRLMHTLDVLDLLPFKPLLWEPQNIAYELLKRSENAQMPEEWRQASARIADRLGVAPM
jgi:alpha-amylase/alpha-mannosidase (GH57 family)